MTVEHRGQRDVSYETARHDADAIVEFLVRRGVIEGEAREMPALLHPATPLAGSEQFVGAGERGGGLSGEGRGAFLQAGDAVFDIVDPLTDAVTTAVRTKTMACFICGGRSGSPTRARRWGGFRGPLRFGRGCWWGLERT